MLAERYLKSRYEKGKKDGREEGRKEGREEGREEVQKLWVAWNRCREEALREGKEFTEPSPGETEKVQR